MPHLLHTLACYICALTTQAPFVRVLFLFSK
jgi:hypothetical protein